MIRLGLCCQFADEPIAFRRATATGLRSVGRSAQLEKLAEICCHNATALARSLAYCAAQHIGAFRVNSQILPLRTHPEVGYRVEDLPRSAELLQRFCDCGRFARERGMRLSFHPDQFVVIAAPDTGVCERSLDELRYQAEVAAWLGADVINVHGGGAYGDKPAALARLRRRLECLPDAVRQRLTLENDDRVYTPADLLPVCRDAGVPFVYDVHHHRCLPDGLTVDEVTLAAARTWAGREPLFHLSSPRHGWDGPDPRQHHDYIDVHDFPSGWRTLTVTVDAEAKAKELAVQRLAADLYGLAVPTWPGTSG